MTVSMPGYSAKTRHDRLHIVSIDEDIEIADGFFAAAIAAGEFKPPQAGHVAEVFAHRCATRSASLQ